jgi:signal transduction histidine kinase
MHPTGDGSLPLVVDPLIGRDGRAWQRVVPARRDLDVVSPPVDSDPMDAPSHRVGSWPIVAISTALGVFSSLQAYNYVTFFTEKPQPFYVLLALNLTYWYAWAALVPGMLWMARWYRFTRGARLRAALMHAAGVLVFTLAHSLTWVTARVWIVEALTTRELTWWLAFRELFFLNFDWEMMTYWAVVGLGFALEFHRESRARELTAAELQTRLAEAQLQSLQRQLHPHFLFNTLHAISALMHRDIEAADTMLARLSDLLRLTIERFGTQTVTVKDEIDFLEKYLEIERARLGSRLQVRVEVDPETLDAQVPNLLLQPLVENAIRHGIAPRVDGGRVEVAVAREGDTLRLVVCDNGAGLPAGTSLGSNAGVGIGNTRTRLDRLYGDRHRFEFATPSGGGLAVTVVIPYVVASDPPEGSHMERVA